MKRKQIQRTCRGCGKVRYVDPKLSSLRVTKQPGRLAQTFMSAEQVNQVAAENQLALSVTSCAGCGATSYKDKEVKI